MHESACSLFQDWPRLVGRIVGKVELDALAAETKALLRRRGVPDAEALLGLALARGPGGLSLRDTAAWAHLAGVADLTDASLNDRLHNSCDFLAAVASAMLKSKVPGAEFRWPGQVIRISDGTCVSKPGSKGTDWGVHAAYDLGAAGFSNFDVTDARGGEALNRGAAIPGEIRLADRNYSTAKGFRRFVESAGEAASADYIVRLRWTSLHLTTPEGPFWASTALSSYVRTSGRNYPALVARVTRIEDTAF